MLRLAQSVALAFFVVACGSDDNRAPCEGEPPPTDCTEAAGDWTGTWTVVGGQYDGLSGSYEMTVEQTDCRISGSLAISGESATLSGRMCTTESGFLTLSSDLGTGTATITFEGDTQSGAFRVNITRPAMSLFDPEPGTYQGTFEATR